jgi:penicillin-binding protein 2
MLKSNHTLINKKIEQRLFISRFKFLGVILSMMFLLLLLRLAYLEIHLFKRYNLLSNKNQFNILSIPPTRGLIYDRNGLLLAKNIPVFSLEILPEKAKNIDGLLEKIGKLITLRDDDIASFRRGLKQHRAFDLIPLKVKLNQEEVATIAVNQQYLPGTEVKARMIRYYPYGKTTAHILGYVGRINSHDLANIDQNNYQGTNFIGKVGIEKYYEDQLHGSIGHQQVETDASSRVVRTISKKPSQSGTNLHLSIDIELQKVAEKALEGYQGAIVAIDPQNGEVLSMVSIPSYDPNPFVQGISQKDYSALSNSKQQPLYNRAIRGQYPLASTIKPFLALFALDQRVIDLDYKVYDPGWFKLPNTQHLYRDWKRGGHGWVRLEYALVVSCDTFFYQLAQLLGIQRINDVLTQFGFGHSTQIDMGEELPGLIPSPQWKKNVKHTPWYTGDTLISGIGQGFMLTTPLQLANATAKLANRGRGYKPHLLRSYEQDNVITPNKVQEDYPITLHESQIWETIINAMEAVVINRHGTGFRFGRKPGYSVAAKTGTAQVYSIKQHQFETQDDLPEFLRDHSLIIAFAPKIKPKIAVAVLVENNNIASNVARKVIDQYLLKSAKDHHESK